MRARRAEASRNDSHISHRFRERQELRSETSVFKELSTVEYTISNLNEEHRSSLRPPTGVKKKYETLVRNISFFFLFPRSSSNYAASFCIPLN